MLRNTLLKGGGLGLALSFVLCSSLPVYAVTPDPEQALKIAGQVQDSVKDRDIITPPKANVQIEVNEEQPEGEPSKDGFKFPVKGFQFSGIGTVNELALREDKLQELIKDSVDKELTLSELKAVARRVTKYFHDKGYMVARAYIPAQKLEDGIITIAVLPGKYANIELRNHSRLSDSMARKMLAAFDPGSYVKRSELERTLLLISDTGGVSIKANLQPGDTTGTSTLVVDIGNTEALTAELSMNNYGNRYTGKDLRSFNLDAHNVTGRGDQLGFHVDNSGGGLTNAGLDYIVPIGGQGAKLGIGYEQLRYSLGEDFAALDAYGTSKNTNIYLTYPLVRTYNYNLYARLGYSNRRLEDRIDQQYTFNERHADVWTLGLTGDSRDAYHGGGLNSFGLIISAGRLNIDDGELLGSIPAKESDQLGPQTAGSYAKANMYFSRLQHLSDRTNLFLGFRGQMAGKNLDSSEKIYLGGGDGVRAYPQGEASGDQGYLLTAELRYKTKNPSLQMVGFIDYGYVDGNKNYYTGAAEDRTLSGAGLGLIYTRSKQYTLRLDYAWKLGDEAAESDDDQNGRFWIRGTRYFE